MRRLFRAAGLDGHARLAFSECLGPCSEANVVFAYVGGRPLWLRRMNTIEPFNELLDHLRALAAGAPASTVGAADGLPPLLAARSFAWTGGGQGPEPPIADA
jgi:hypothetical protein